MEIELCKSASCDEEGETWGGGGRKTGWRGAGGAGWAGESQCSLRRAGGYLELPLAGPVEQGPFRSVLQGCNTQSFHLKDSFFAPGLFLDVN